ncbi:MAG: sodium:dicarboxylate symporter, partial [Gemmatimonadetes bacterium]|nr:sodium:dicarboxylate symporter [Gemmatimonadota bacterium]
MRSARGGSALHALVALAVGLAIGIAISASGSAGAIRVVGWIEPLGTMWVNAIRMTVIPLIVSSLLVAVSATAPGTVGRLGTRAFVIFFILLSVMAAITAVVAPLIFTGLTIDPAAAQAIRAGVAPVQRPEMPGFSSWVVSLVPTNPIKAAADGAMLPLVVFTLAFGLAIGRLSEDVRAPIVAFFRGVAESMTLLVQWVLILAPLGVFALALALATKLGTSVVGAVGFYVIVHSGLQLAGVVLLYVAVTLFSRVSLARFARAALPAQIVAMTTRSSMAALPAMLTSAEETLGLPRTVTSFALPLATSTFRFNQAVTWVVVALFAAKLYGIDLAAAQIATIAVTSVLMSFSVPGIPSASLFVIAPFLASVGIPAEAIGVLIAIDLLPDVFKTLANVTGHL